MAIGETITAAGARFADVGIIGGPPKQPWTTKFYASGPGAAEFAQLEQHGLSVRVPLWVVSPHAKTGPVASSLPAEHTSTLKLIESLYGLTPLSARNHLFDTATPTGSNYDAGGAPAPPRDGRDDISNLLDLFAF